MIFETERLIIRPWNLENDFEAAYALYSDERVTQWIGMEPIPERDNVRSLLERTTSRDAMGAWRLGVWAVELKSNQTVVGSVLVKPMPGDIQLEVGWHFIPDHWGNGYATEAARGALEYAFREFNVDSIDAITNLGNEPSNRVCARLGMAYLGTTERYHNRELNLFRIQNPTR